MHESVMAWVAAQVAEHELASLPTLEVGSFDVNGSVRSLFSGPYIGVDTRPGPGVDEVMSGHALRFPAASFRVCVSTEMLEHDPAPWRSLAEMGRVLEPGGHLLVTARGNGFGEHREPEDYFRFMPDSRPLLLFWAGCAPVALDLDPQMPGVFCHGVRA